MGRIMSKRLFSIEFHKKEIDGKFEYVGSVSLQDLIQIGDKRNNLNKQIKKATKDYREFVQKCERIIGKIKKAGSLNQTSLKNMWDLGDQIHRFNNTLKRDGFYLNGLYEHLVRDLQVSRDLLKKVITFRSYFPNSKLIPNDMVWKEVRYAPRKNAEELRKKLLRNKLSKK